MKRFSQWDACLKKAGVKSCLAMYTKIQEEIKKNPDFKKIAAKPKPKRDHATIRKKRLNGA